MEQTKNLKLHKAKLQDIISDSVERIFSDNFDIIDEAIGHSMGNTNLYVALSIDIPESFEISSSAGDIRGSIDLEIYKATGSAPDEYNDQMARDWSTGFKCVLEYHSAGGELIDIEDTKKPEYTYELWYVLQNSKGKLYFWDKEGRGSDRSLAPVNCINISANTACIYIGDITLTRISDLKYQVNAAGLKSFFTTWEQFKLNSPPCAP